MDARGSFKHAKRLNVVNLIEKRSIHNSSKIYRNEIAQKSLKEPIAKLYHVCVSKLVSILVLKMKLRGVYDKVLSVSLSSSTWTWLLCTYPSTMARLNMDLAAFILALGVQVEVAWSNI